MFFVALFVPLAVLTLLALAFVGWRLWGQVRQLGRDVSAASERIAQASDELNRATPVKRG